MPNPAHRIRSVGARAARNEDARAISGVSDGGRNLVGVGRSGAHRRDGADAVADHGD